MSAPLASGSLEPAPAGSAEQQPASAPRLSPDRKLPRKEILRRRSDVERVMRTGIKVAGPSLYLRYARNPDPRTTERRVAFLLPRQIRRAVDRNRVKRQMREVYRLHKERFPAGYDVLLLLPPSAATLGFERLDELTRDLAARLTCDGKTA